MVARLHQEQHMGGKPDHALKADRPESGGADKDMISEKTGLQEKDKQKFAEEQAEEREKEGRAEEGKGEVRGGAGGGARRGGGEPAAGTRPLLDRERAELRPSEVG